MRDGATRQESPWLPKTIYVEVTNRCNSRCRTCIRTFHSLEQLRDLSYGEFTALLGQFASVERLVLHGIGEPLLNPELPHMIAWTKSRHPGSVVLFNSNAIGLTDTWQDELIAAGLDELRVSLDAASPGTYASIRGVDVFDTVVANVRQYASRLAETATARPRLSFWCTALKENLAELPALIDLAGETGVSEVYVQRLVYFGEGLAQAEQSVYRQLREAEEHALVEAGSRAQRLGIALRASGATTPPHSLAAPASARPWAACRRLWSSTYVTANGNVLPCCIAPFATRDYAALILGNVNGTAFTQIWHGPAYAKRRAALDTDSPLHPCELCGSQWSL